MKTTYQKVRFSSAQAGVTAGLVFRSDSLANLSISELSRRFPYSEAMKMAKVQVSPQFVTWAEAFSYQFPS